MTDNNTKVFSATGAGKVYTSSDQTNYTAVAEGETYNSETTYYSPSFTYTDVTLSSGIPTQYTDCFGAVDLTNSWEDKATSVYLYTGYYSSWNTSFVIQSRVTNKTELNTTSADNTTYPNNSRYVISKTELELNGDKTVAINELETEGITWLTLDALKEYYTTTGTYTIRYDSYFVSHDNGATKESLTNGATYTYNVGDRFYKGTASYTAIDDNSNFFTEHASYLESAKIKFVDYLSTAITSDINTVVFKTDASVETAGDNSKKANINNEITRALVKIKSIETLNLQDTYLANIEAHNPSKQDASGNPTEDPTFYLGNLGKYESTLNTTLKTLYMPTTKSGSTLAQEEISSGGSFTVFGFLTGLESLFLGEGIETIDEYAFALKTYSDTDEDGKYVARAFKPYSVTFPNTLKKILKNSFDGQTNILTFTFPAKLEYIQAEAFTSTNPRDVYFLGLEAPKVEANAWGDNSYISNNSLNMQTSTTLSDGGTTGIEVDLQKGVATRSNYYTGNNGWMTMLHYPANCSKAQAAKYTDQTRTYVKIDYGTETDLVKSTTDAQGVTLYVYEAGKETENLKGKTSSTSSQVAAKTFFNRYSDGAFTGGDYTGGYNDIFVGSQYIWPSMGMAYRATVVAQNNLLWDGTTSIADGIKNNLAAGESYDGDGSEYIGLHQFVFAQGDVTTDKTDEWDVTKYADGKWHSICLPFNVTKKMMKETFGPTSQEGGEDVYNIRLCKFNQVDRTDDNLKLYFNDEQFANANDDDIVMNAHVSYMIKAKKENMVEDEKVVIKNYVIAAGTPLPTNVTANAKGGSGSEGETQDGQYYFVGNYTSGITIPQYSYFFSKKYAKFRFMTGTTSKWNGYTSVVEAPNGADDLTKYFSSNDNQAKLSTVWDMDETTGVEKVTVIAGDEIVATNANVYNLSGQLVSTNGRNGLAKGLYIQNGKKFVVK